LQKQAEILHKRFNAGGGWIPPVRVKGFNRVNLACLFAEFGYKVGAEIGVADGRNALTLCQNIPDLTLYCVDPWERYAGNPRAHSTEHQNRCYEVAQQNLEQYNAIFLRQYAEDAYRNFDRESIDFVYIDGNHGFDYVMLDLILWGRLVRPGGMIAGHDYYAFRWAGVVPAVNAYAAAHNVGEWYIDDDRREPSFFWVKG